MRAIPSSVTLALALSLFASHSFAQSGEEDGARTHAPDLTTPRRALSTFLRGARDRDWGRAATALDLREVPSTRQEERVPEISQDLLTVLDSTRVRPERLPDEPLPRGERAIEVVRVPGVEDVVVLRRVSSNGAARWLFTPATVRAARELASRVDRGPVGNAMPDALVEARLLGIEAWQWISLVAALVLAIGISMAITRFLAFVVLRFSGEKRVEGVRPAIAAVRPPIRVLIALAILGGLGTLIHLPAAAMLVVGRSYSLAWVLAGGWLFVRLVDTVAQQVSVRAAREDGWKARGLRTRIMILRRVMHVVGVIILVAAALMQFDTVRQLGVSILASAGVAGIVVGLAAQRTIGNLLAGIQLSFTQPLRVGDSVVIENEFGTVEEINLSYVVVALWDLRRLIVPMSKLLESPFQNWTRATSELIGAVTMPVDFATPFDRVRQDLERFVRAHPLFDGRTFAVQVVDAGDRSATLRVLVSASDSGRTFDLRCAVREHLIGLLQGLDRGKYLPRVRVTDSVGGVDDVARA